MIILIVKYHLVSVHVSPLKCKLLGASIISDLAMAIYPYIECCLIHNQNLKYFMNSGVLNNKKLFPPQVKQNKHSPIKDGSTFYCFPLPPQASQSILKPLFFFFFCWEFLIGSLFWAMCQVKSKLISHLNLMGLHVFLMWRGLI